MYKKHTDEKPVVVIGAGVVGTMTALSFARQGYNVVVIDRANGPAEICSQANAGILGICHATPWASPEAIPTMIRAALGRAPGIRLTNPLDPKLVPWGLSFLKNCTPAAYKTNAEKLRRLSLYSRNMLAVTEAEMGLPKETRHDGGLYLFQDKEQFQHFAKEFKDNDNFEILTPNDIIRLDSGLAEIAKTLTGAIFSKVDSVGDCRQFTQRTCAYLREKNLVDFRFDETVTGFEHAGGQITTVVTDKERIQPASVIIASGVKAPELCKPLGFTPQIYPVKGYSGTWQITNPSHAPRLPYIDETELVAVANYNDTSLRITTLAEFNGLDTSMKEEQLQILKDYVLRYYKKAVDFDSVKFWCGHRPATPAGPPYLGRIKKFDNLWINAGHGQLGWTIAQGCGELLVQKYQGKPLDMENVSSHANSWLESL